MIEVIEVVVACTFFEAISCFIWYKIGLKKVEEIWSKS